MQLGLKSRLDEMIELSVEETEESYQRLRLLAYKELHAFNRKGRLYKYRTANDNAFHNLETQSLFCSDPEKFSDPAEFRARLTNETGIRFREGFDPKEWEKKNTSILKKLFLVGCMTTRCDNQRMWNDYAGNGTGFCIEYDMEKAFANNPSISEHLFPIYYTDHSTEFPTEYARRGPKAYAKEILRIAYRTLLTKRMDYQYEEEWRLLVGACDSDNSDGLNIYLPVSAVYLGMNISRENKKKVIEIAERNSIDMRQV